MKVLLIGLGNSGKAHLRAYRSLNIHPYISDSDPEREEEYLRRGYRVGDPNAEYDYVDICVPTHRHYQVCREWLTKANVLCEKPFTLESNHAEELIKIAEDHGRKLGVVHNQLYYPLIEALEPGIRCMLVDRTYDEAYPSWVYTDGGGTLYETGYHAIYLLNHLMRPKPKLRSYRNNSQGHTLTFDSAQIRIFMGSKFEDRIRLFYDDSDLTVFPWFNSQSEDKLFRRAAMYWYCATNGREMPHTSTYREMLDEWVIFICKRNNSPVLARLSPYLSLETVTVLESCEKWRDRTE